MSLARRSSAVKMMVSPKRTTGLTVVSRVRRSPDIVSSPSSSSLVTCKVNASVACSRTRWDCSVRFSKSATWRGVATLMESFLPSSGGGDGQHVVVDLEGHEVVSEHQVRGDAANEFGIDALLAEVDKCVAVTLGKLTRDFALLLLVGRRGDTRSHVGMVCGRHEAVSWFSRR